MARKARDQDVVRAPFREPEGGFAVRVAYHAGPPEIHFAGLPWRRGVADTVSVGKWAEMQARGDFKDFDFRLTEAQPTADAADKED